MRRRGERRHGHSMTKQCVSLVFGVRSNHRRTFLASVLRAIWVPTLAAASLVCPPAPWVLLLGRLHRHGVSTAGWCSGNGNVDVKGMGVDDRLQLAGSTVFGLCGECSYVLVGWSFLRVT